MYAIFTNSSFARFLATTAIAVVAAFFAPSSNAATPLSDSEMSQVYGQGSVSIQSTTPQPQTPQVPFLSPFTQFLDPSLALVTTISSTEFATEITAAGGTPFGAPLYDGRDVVRMQFNNVPAFNATIDLSQLIVPIPGATDGAHLGTIQINQMNISGTTVWVWSH